MIMSHKVVRKQTLRTTENIIRDMFLSPVKMFDCSYLQFRLFKKKCFVHTTADLLSIIVRNCFTFLPAVAEEGKVKSQSAKCQPVTFNIMMMC